MLKNQILVAAVLLLMLSALVVAEEETNKGRRNYLVVTGSVMQSVEIAHSIPDRSLAALTIGWEWEFSNDYAFRLEAIPIMGEYDPESIPAYGWDLAGLKYWGDDDSTRTWAEAGGGMSWANEEYPIQGAMKFSYILYFGAGFDFPVTEQGKFILGYRLYHLSNGNLGDRNPGINAHTLLFGYKHRF